MVKGIQKKKKPKWKIVMRNGQKYLIYGKKKFKITSNLRNRELKNVFKRYGKLIKKKVVKKKKTDNVSNKKPEISGSQLNIAHQDIRNLQKKLDEEKKKLDDEQKKTSDLTEKKRLAKLAQKMAEAQLILFKNQIPQLPAPQQQKLLTFTLPNPTTGVVENVELTEEAAKKLIPIAEKAGWKISQTKKEADKAKKEADKAKEEADKAKTEAKKSNKTALNAKIDLLKKQINEIKGRDKNTKKMKIWIAKQIGLTENEYIASNNQLKGIKNILNEADEENINRFLKNVAKSGKSLDEFRKESKKNKKEKKEESEDEIEALDLDEEIKKNNKKEIPEESQDESDKEKTRKIREIYKSNYLFYNSSDDNKKDEKNKKEKSNINLDDKKKKKQDKNEEIIELNLDDELTDEENEENENTKRKKADGKADSSKGLYDNEINEMMMPYRKKGFLGTIASDEIPKLLPKVGFRKKVSFIMNTDKSTGPGKHWQGINITPETIEFYDSFGDPPTKQFMKDIEPLIRQIHPNKYLKFIQNKIKVQDDRSSNCGYFSVKWLQDRLDGKPFIDAVKTSRTRQAEKNIKKFKNTVKK